MLNDKNKEKLVLFK